MKLLYVESNIGQPKLKWSTWMGNSFKAKVLHHQPCERTLSLGVGGGGVNLRRSVIFFENVYIYIYTFLELYLFNTYINTQIIKEFA